MPTLKITSQLAFAMPRYQRNRGEVEQQLALFTVGCWALITVKVTSSVRFARKKKDASIRRHATTEGTEATVLCFVYSTFFRLFSGGYVRSRVGALTQGDDGSCCPTESLSRETSHQCRCRLGQPRRAAAVCLASYQTNRHRPRGDARLTN